MSDWSSRPYPFDRAAYGLRKKKSAYGGSFTGFPSRPCSPNLPSEASSVAGLLSVPSFDLNSQGSNHSKNQRRKFSGRVESLNERLVPFGLHIEYPDLNGLRDSVTDVLKRMQDNGETVIASESKDDGDDVSPKGDEANNIAAKENERTLLLTKLERLHSDCCSAIDRNHFLQFESSRIQSIVKDSKEYASKMQQEIRGYVKY